MSNDNNDPGYLSRVSMAVYKMEQERLAEEASHPKVSKRFTLLPEVERSFEGLKVLAWQTVFCAVNELVSPSSPVSKTKTTDKTPPNDNNDPGYLSRLSMAVYKMEQERLAEEASHPKVSKRFTLLPELERSFEGLKVLAWQTATSAVSELVSPSPSPVNRPKTTGKTPSPD
jgi:hypothetical protein